MATPRKYTEEVRERIQGVRRRVLIAQLARLAERVLGGTDPASLDAAARGVRLASRLERNDLAW